MHETNGIPENPNIRTNETSAVHPKIASGRGDSELTMAFPY